MTPEIHLGDCLEVMSNFDSASFERMYIDPPFNTGKAQSRKRLQTLRDGQGDRTGFQGARHRSRILGESSFDDCIAFREPRLREACRLFSPQGSFFLHIGCRESHCCKLLLDRIFGRESFVNETIWAYDHGARSKGRGSARHDTMFRHATNPVKHICRHDDIDRVPCMAPGLAGPEKAAKGKTPADVWRQTIVSPNGKEKTGCPTRKPVAILNRILRVPSNPGDRALDFFADSGPTGEAAVRGGRNAVLVDCNVDAIRVMEERLAFANPAFHGGKHAGDPRSGSGDTGNLFGDPPV